MIQVFRLIIISTGNINVIIIYIIDLPIINKPIIYKWIPLLISFTIILTTDPPHHRPDPPHHPHLTLQGYYAALERTMFLGHVDDASLK